MFIAFDFDEYWNQFNQSPDPEFFDPVIELLYPVEDEPSLNDLPEQLSLF